MTWPKPSDRCKVCGCSLESRIDQLIGVCQRNTCRGPYLAKKRREDSERKQADRREALSKANRLVSQVIEGTDWEPSEAGVSTHLSLVPCCESKVCPPSGDRIQEFVNHLDSILSQVEEFIRDETKLRSVLTEFGHREGSPVESAMMPVINGCSTCRGYCCRHGGTTAFLTIDFFAWQMLCDPTLTLESLRSAYLSKLPGLATEDSCVFHGAQGCVLPRIGRNSICNEFHCSELLNSLDAFYENGDRRWIAVSSGDSHLTRIGIVDSGGRRREFQISTR